MRNNNNKKEHIPLTST